MSKLAAFALAYFLLALYGASLPLFERAPLFIWPGHGFALGVLLAAPMGRWGAYLAVTLAATLAAGLAIGIDASTLAATCILALTLPAIVAFGLARLAGPRVQIDSIRGLAAFLVGMVPLAAGVAILEAAYAYLATGAVFRPRWTLAFVSSMLGMLLTAPLVLAWTRDGIGEALAEGRSRAAELIALYVGLVFTTHYIFATGPETTGITPPLLYLCAPFLIWAALRFGLRSATLGLAVFGLMCYWYTAHGWGPFAPAAASGGPPLLHLHAYLATIIVTTLFSATLLVERREAARETEEWRFRHERVIRASQSLLYEFDPASGQVVWDGDTQRVIGADPASVSDVRGWMARVHPDDRIRLKGLRKQLISGELSHIAMEYRFRRDDGEYSTLGVNAYLIGDAARERGGRRVAGFVKDVSDKVRADEERRRLEAQLKQAEKMQAVGHLAGGIAHDFNNILGAILGYGELAQRKAEGDQRRYLDTIMDAGNRAKALVTQILSYSRAEGAEKIPVVVAPIAMEACDLVRGSTPKAIDVRFVSGANDATVLGDPTRLHQLLMNLSTNAIHAMDDGGTLEVGVEIERLEAPRRVRSGEVPSGDYVRVTVRDTGHGIAPEVIDRIFEPFFTTKPAGRGTGLGLALVHSVVTEHQGYIDVASELGRGTTFTVWMPRIEGAAAEEAAPAEMPMGQGQSVLVVDDEPEVLAALEEMLASLGYEPAGYRNGREALEAVRAQPRRFEAVVSDEVMPELSGTQLAIELRRINPTLPILIASGYGGAGFETRALSAGVNRVIKKPYRMSEIAQILEAFFISTARSP
jgi:signal transduction histidine kinase/CheY-like chemotaxis protein